MQNSSDYLANLLKNPPALPGILGMNNVAAQYNVPGTGTATPSSQVIGDFLKQGSSALPTPPVQTFSTPLITVKPQSAPVAPAPVTPVVKTPEAPNQGNTDQNALGTLLASILKSVTSVPTYDTTQEDKIRRDVTNNSNDPMAGYSFDIQRNNELRTFNAESAKRLATLDNSLALAGTYGVSSQGDEKTTELKQNEANMRQAIVDKWEIQKSAASTTAKKEMVDNIDKKITAYKTAFQTQLDTFYKGLTTNLDVAKTLSDNDYKQKQLALDTKFKEGSLTNDQYKAQTDRLKANADIAKINSEITPAGGGRDPMNSINLVKNSITNAENLAGASGRSGLRKGIESWLVGSTNYTNLVAETNTLRTNVLTMMTDPTIKKFFGPQMSNADVQLMTSAGTTLNPELQDPDKMKLELTRLKDLVGRAEKAVTDGMSSEQKTASATQTRTVTVTDPKTGQSKTGPLTNADIEDAKTKGYQVQ